jgi:hypothetical protein
MIRGASLELHGAGACEWHEEAAFWAPPSFKQFLETVSVCGGSRGTPAVKAKPVQDGFLRPQ